ncbi:hypothetical protein [Streptomyces orinoci]|uniref:Lipoprotein n=1 Tax=Streptomyces orinoci TaxID=67339 RepID=A0ABV3JYJ1_STRON|nr:hypothetical protein [Streptomyces orinoci]
MRKAAQITGAAVIAAVLMTGCSKSSDGGDKKADGSASASAQPAQQQPSSQAPAQDKSTDFNIADLKGAWAKGKLLDNSLVIVSISGNYAAVSAGKEACSGKLAETRPITMDLKCQPAGGEYSKGTIKRYDGKSITVAWASGKEDVLEKKVSDGKPVNGLPVH